MWTIGGTGCTYAGSVAAEALQLTSDGGHVVVEDLQSASELGVTAGPLGQHLGMGLDGGVQGLEQRVALSGVKLKGALARSTPPPGLEGEAGLLGGERGFNNGDSVVHWPAVHSWVRVGFGFS